MQPESASPEPIVPPEAVPQPEAAPQPVAPVRAAVVRPVAPPPPKKGGNCLVTILVTLLILVLLSIAAGLGFWGYTLNNNLTATTQEIATLQGKHDKLVTDNEKLTTDIAKVKADIEKTGKSITATQADLTKAQQSSKETADRITQTVKLMDVALAIYTTNDTLQEVGQKIKATNDAKLSSLWDKFTASRNREDLSSFLDYLFTTIADNIKKK